MILPDDKGSSDLKPDFNFDKDQHLHFDEEPEEIPIKEFVIRPAIRTIEKSMDIGGNSNFEKDFVSDVHKSELSEPDEIVMNDGTPQSPEEKTSEVEETVASDSDTLHIESSFKDPPDVKIVDVPGTTEEQRQALYKVLTILPSQYLKRSLAFDDVCKRILNIRSLKDAIGLIEDMFKTPTLIDSEAKDFPPEEEEEEPKSIVIVRPPRRFYTEVFPPAQNFNSKTGEKVEDRDEEKSESANVEAEHKDDGEPLMLGSVNMQTEDKIYEDGERPSQIVIIRPGWRQYSEHFPSKPNLKHSFSEQWEKPTKIVITRPRAKQYTEHFSVPAKFFNQQHEDDEEHDAKVMEHIEVPVQQEYRELNPLQNAKSDVTLEEQVKKDPEVVGEKDTTHKEYKELKSYNDKGKYFAPPQVQKEVSKIEELIHPLLKKYIGKMLI